MADIERVDVERLLEVVKTVAEMAAVARAETVALRGICGTLLAEVVREAPDPSARLGQLTAELQGTAHSALAEFGDQKVAVAQTQLLDQVVRIAEEHVARFPPAESPNG